MQFKDVVGQAELKAHLIQEINANKISHAKLFLGNAGHGGLPLALAYVNYLFCENKQATDSCGTCASCLKNKEFQHPDLHFSFPIVLSNNKTCKELSVPWREQLIENPYFDLTQWTSRIDDKQRKPIIGTEEGHDIIRKLSLKSYEGKEKVMIIWMAEEMNPTCSNNLLKILEEPPEKTIFILLAENQENMLQTILSRTQIMRIPRVNMHELTFYLEKTHHIDPSSSTSIAAQSDGNLLDVFEQLDTSNSKGVQREMFIQLMRVCYKKDVIPMMDWAEAISVIGKEPQKNFLKYAMYMFRQSLLKNYTDDQFTRTSKEEADFLKNFSKFITGNNIQGFLENFNDAYFHIDRNANAKIVFTELCFKVMRFIHFA